MSVYTTAMILAASTLGFAPAQQTAGLTTPGTNEYPHGGMRHVGSLFTSAGLNGSAIDVSDRNLYFGQIEGEGPGAILKMDLDSFAVTDTLVLADGEDNIRHLELQGAMLYASVWHRTKYTGRLVQISIAEFERIDALDLSPLFWFGVDDRAGGFIYVSDGDLLHEVDPDTMTSQRQLSRPHLTHALVDSTRGYMYAAGPDGLDILDLETLEEIDTLPIFLPFGSTGYTPVLHPDHGTAFWSGGCVGCSTRLDLASLEATQLHGKLNRVVGLDSSAGLVFFAYDPPIIWNRDTRELYMADSDTLSKTTSLPFKSPSPNSVLQLGRHDSVTKAEYFPSTYFLSGNEERGQLLKITSARDQSLNASRIDLPEPATIQEMRFYSHVAEGNIRFAFYNDAKPKSLLWQSSEIANTVEEGEIIVPIADGEPPALNLAAGTYWAAFQIDTRADVPSYTAGGEGEGWVAPYRFGPAPLHVHDGPTTTTLPFIPAISAVSDDGLTTQTERWTQYVTYEAFKADQWVVE